MTYSLDFRHRVLDIRERNHLTIKEVSLLFDIGFSSVSRWIKSPNPQCTRNKPSTKLDMAALSKDIEAYPDGYQHERAKRLGVSINCILYGLRRLKVTYKKNSKTSEGRRREAIIISRKDSYI